MTDHGELLHFVTQAHRKAARENENLSSAVVSACGAASTTFQQAIIGALSTLGEIHGPTRQARRFIYDAPVVGEDQLALQRWENELHGIMDEARIPGWGNSFHKQDPAWVDVRGYLEFVHPSHIERLDAITASIRKRKDIHPNAAAYTAVTAEILGLPAGTELQIVIQARVSVWGEQWDDARGLELL